MHLSELLEIKPIDVINAVIVPLFFALALGVAISRYINFTMLIERAVVNVQRLFPLYHPEGQKEANRTLAELHADFAAIALILKFNGHADAAGAVWNLWTRYSGLVTRAIDQSAKTGDKAATREWFKETTANFAIRLLRIDPNWLQLFRLRYLHSDAEVTDDRELSGGRAPQKIAQNPVI